MVELDLIGKVKVYMIILINLHLIARNLKKVIPPVVLWSHVSFLQLY